MIAYPNIDPVLVSVDAFTVFGFTVGPLSVHWYGMMYLFGFAAAWLLGVYRTRQPWSPLKKNHIEDLIFYAAIGVVAGGRCGYVFFYGFSDFLEDPLWLFKVWDGGMSFHGGMLGVMAAMALYAKKIKQNFVSLMDSVVLLAPIGLGFGRLGNFIGAELWGRETDVAWGMVFPTDPGVVRHPSQLYEMFLEGIVLFIILFWFSCKPRPRGVISGLFLIGYGCFRFAVEFVREPDAHLGIQMLGWMTRGQQLCLPMILFGLALVFYGYFAKPAVKR